MGTDHIAGNRTTSGRAGLLRTALALFVGAVCLCSSAGAAIEDRNVLLLFSYKAGLPVYNQLAPAFLQTLQAAGVRGENVSIEYLDLAGPQTPERRQELDALLKGKYGRTKVDLVVGVQWAVVPFLKTAKLDYLRKSPVLMYLLAKPTEPMGIDHRLAEMTMPMDVKGTLSQAFGLFPRSGRLLVLNGPTAEDQALWSDVRHALTSLGNRREVQELSTDRLDDVLARAAEMGSNDLILLLPFAPFVDGRSVTGADVARRVSAATKAPVFVVAPTMLGTGAVGGSVADFEQEGRRLGRAALGMLNGVAPSVAGEEASPAKPTYDWAVLKRFHANIGSLPKDVVFLNRRAAPWELYPRHTAAVALMLLAETVTIVLLVWSRRGRAEAERSLAASEARFRALVEQAPEAVLVLNIDTGQFVEANHNAELLFGRGRQDLLASKFERFYAPEQPDGRPVAESVAERVARAGAGESLVFERIVRTPDGQDRFCVVHMAPLPGVAKHLVRVSYVDVTEQRKAEQALREKEEFQRKILERLPVGALLLVDSGDRVVYRNPRLATMFGYTGDDVQTVSEYWTLGFRDPADRDRAMAQWERLMAALSSDGDEPQVVEMDMPTAYGTTLHVRVQAVHIGDAVLVTYTDLTDLVRAGEAVRESQERLAFALEGAGLGSWEWYPQEDRLACDDGWARLCGYTLDEVEQTVAFWEGMLHPDDREEAVRRLMDHINGLSPAYESEQRRRSKTGEWVWVLDRGRVLVRDEQGRALRASGVVMDITPRKESEEAVRLSRERLKLALEGGELGLWDYYPQTDRIVLGEGWNRMLGYDDGESEHPFEFFKQALHSDERDAVLEQFRRHLSGEDPAYQSEHRLRTKSGDWLWVIDRGKVLEWDAQGHAVRASGIVFDVTRRRHNEDALKKSEEAFRTLAEQAPAPIALIDPSGRIDFFNERFVSTFGYTLEEVPTLDEWWKRAYPDPALREKRARGWEEACERAIREHTDIKLDEVTVTCRDGSVRTVFVTAAFIGERRMAIFNDITERHRMEAQLRLDEMRLEALLELGQMTQASSAGITSYAMEQAVRLTGSDVGYVAFVTEDQTTMVIQAWSETAMETCRAAEQPLEYRIEDAGLWGEAVRQRKAIVTNDYQAPDPLKHGVPEGHVPLTRHLNVPIIDGDKVVVVGGVANKATPYDDADVRQLTLLMDGMWRIHQRNQQQKALAESERRLSTLFSNLPGIAYRCKNDPNWTMEFLSEGCLELTGYSSADLVGNARASYSGITHPEDRDWVRAQIHAALGQRRPYEVVYRITTAQGPIKWVWEKGIGVFGPGGEVQALEGLITDISELVRAQNELREARDQLEVRVQERTRQLETANKELEAFSYSVSHDLRAPLRAMNGFSRILLDDYADRLDEQGRGYLDRICAGADKMGQLIEGLLLLSRIGRNELRLRTVNLSETVGELASKLRELEPSRKVEFRIQPEVTGYGDPTLLTAALENLLGNAWKYTGQHETALIEFGTERRDDRTVYFVRDDGAGFDMNYADKLFGPFQRLHRPDEFPGMGIGLATVHRIVRRHEGDVWAEGEVEKGATFYFTLGLTPGPGEA